MINNDMIMGLDLISELKSMIDFDTKSLSWDNIDQPMKSQVGGGRVERNYPLQGPIYSLKGSEKYCVTGFIQRSL
jgi:hypothetical protein